MLVVKRIKYSNFDTNNVINMSYILCKCLSLKEINLSSFDTNNVEDMNHMFSE